MADQIIPSLTSAQTIAKKNNYQLISSTYGEKLIEAEDFNLFVVPTSTTPGDKRTLLRAQKIVANTISDYVYLEVGSYKGGSLVPHLLHSSCRQVISIDKRPMRTPDNRAVSFDYEGVTADEMVSLLSRVVHTDNLNKLKIYTNDAGDPEVQTLGRIVDIAFIDGEHTNVACFKDFLNVFSMVSADGIICLHDANLVIDAIYNIRTFLAHMDVEHEFLLLPDLVAIFALGRSIDLVIKCFQSDRLDEIEYTRRAKRILHEEIAGAVACGAHLYC